MASIRNNKIRVRIKNFLRGLAVFASIVGVVLVMVFFHETPKKYVGTVIEVSTWSGNAKLRTTTESGRDTIIEVHKQNHETFEIGQTITVWTGGELFTGVATTKPQN